MAIRQYERNEVLIFITNMKKTSQPVLKALIHYANEMAKRDELRYEVSKVVDLINKGKNIEDSLHERGFINDFQYAILINSQDKNEAYEKVLKYNIGKNEADKFYRKKFLGLMIPLIALSFGMPYLIAIINGMIQQVKNINDEFEPSSFVMAIIHFNDGFTVMGVICVVILLVGIVFYYYTYKNDLPLHYRFFRLKAMNDTHMYFTLIVDMLKSGIKTFSIFELLGKYMIPLSSRDIFLTIRDRLKNNQDYTEEFKNLGVNDFTIFILKTAREIKDIKGGFVNALVSIDDYKSKKEEEYKEVVDFIAWLVLVISFAIFFLFLTIATIDVSMV
jgi:type II secretory pathway component PulF